MTISLATVSANIFPIKQALHRKLHLCSVLFLWVCCQLQQRTFPIDRADYLYKANTVLLSQRMAWQGTAEWSDSEWGAPRMQYIPSRSPPQKRNRLSSAFVCCHFWGDNRRGFCFTHATDARQMRSHNCQPPPTPYKLTWIITKCFDTFTNMPHTDTTHTVQRAYSKCFTSYPFSAALGLQTMTV